MYLPKLVFTKPVIFTDKSYKMMRVDDSYVILVWHFMYFYAQME